MMKKITKKSREDIKLMRHAGQVVAQVHQAMKKNIQAGISTLDLDKIAQDVIKKNKCTPTFLGYYGYPASICTSVNEQVVHGIPNEKIILKEGDIISVDVGATFRNFVGDSAWTYSVGKIDEKKQKLLEITEKSLKNAMAKIKNGVNIDDVVGEIEDLASENKLGLVRQYGGHGIGSSMHEEPFIYNYRTNSDLILHSGMMICVEPMLNLGCDDVHTLADEWTVVTNDNQPSAHFEHTMSVTDDGYEIMTKL